MTPFEDVYRGEILLVRGKKSTEQQKNRVRMIIVRLGRRAGRKVVQDVSPGEGSRCNT
jgi:hypothetical protein